MSKKYISELKDYTINQINNFFPIKKKLKSRDINKEFQNAIERSMNCFKKIKIKYYDKKKFTF